MGRFITLKLYGTKVYKFTQGKTILTLLGDIPDAEYMEVRTGVCAALTVDWLVEKLTRPWTLQFTGDFAGGRVHFERNRETVQRNVRRQLDYDRHGSTSQLLQDAGLKEYDQPPIFGPTITFDTKLARIAAATENGRGAYVGITAAGRGHAVGMYRSRRAHLYFFDANCGVYQVDDQNAPAFFNELATCYANIQYPLAYTDASFVRT
ncbi:MAG: hypothetical protein KIS78_11170 [Labilithrix sp.]|nr:hypothetical protein [Labilithrix sp.]